MSLAMLPKTGEKIGSGGFGEVFLDPTDSTRCIKKFTRPVKGSAATRLMDIVSLPGRLLPSERAFLMSRFAWPIEVFGTERSLVGHRMLLAPESAMFALTATNRSSVRLLQAMYVLDSSYWQRAAVQSEQPALSTDGRLLVIHDLISALSLLHDKGFAYVDLSAKNVCIANGEVPHVFLLDADSVVPTSALNEPDVRTADWEVDERLSLIGRDWAKAAIFGWRLLLQERLLRPQSTDVADFDRHVGVPIGAAIARLHDQPDDESAAALSAAIRAALADTTQDSLIEVVAQQGFARPIIALRDLERMPSELLSAANEQLALEVRVEASTGLARRLLTRGLRHEAGRRFELDVLGDSRDSAAPSSAAELERLILEARFEEVLAHFVDGQLTNFIDHPWRDRAIQHALVLEPDPVLDLAESNGIISARFEWPESPLVDVARLRMWAGRDLIDERIVERRAHLLSVRIRGIGAGLAQGIVVRLQLTFGVRSDDGFIVQCPSATTVSVPATGRPVRRQRQVVRTLRSSAVAVSSRGQESLVDVARPDPNAPARRRTRRNRRVLTAASAVLVAVSSFLLPQEAPQERLDAAALVTSDGIEVVWAVRSSEDLPSAIERSAVQRRIFGLIWFRESETVNNSDLAAGEIVRVVLKESEPIRIAVTLKNGDRLRSDRLDPVPRDAIARGAPDAVRGLTEERLGGDAIRIEWDSLDVGVGRIVEEYQVVVLDTTGRLITRDATGNLGWTVARRDVLRAPLGLEVRVRAVASDGSRSPWATVATMPIDPSSIPKPSSVELTDDLSGQRILSWRVAPVAQGVNVTSFEVSVADVAAGEQRLVEVKTNGVSAAELFGPDGSAMRVVRVRSVLQDGAVGPWSDALIIGREQIDPAR